MADVLDRMRQEIGDRLSELRPAVEEYKRLQAAIAVLVKVPAASSTGTASSPGATPATRKLAGGRRRAGRPRGSGRAPVRVRATLAPTTPASAAETAPAVPSVSAAQAPPVRKPRRAKVRSRRRVRHGAGQQAILAAVEHGPHSVRELVTVTGMSDQTVRNNLGRLVGQGTVAKTDRNGKTAYALPLRALAA